MENGYTDTLSKLASSRDSDLMKAIPVEKLNRPSIDESLAPTSMTISESPRWMKEIITYLTDQVLSSDRQEAQKLRRRAVKFGYYWPTKKKDSYNYVNKCDKCQKFATIPKLPAQNLTSVTNHWPFAKWGIDFIGPLLTGRGGVKFAVVAVDYFTMWCEAESWPRSRRKIRGSFCGKTSSAALKSSILLFPTMARSSPGRSSTQTARIWVYGGTSPPSSIPRLMAKLKL
ncbi:reverse transcriptase [Abeliophyllum distichum]|uniref:Reverse transcriptase n=1 Tax=Abeliophyllum distichum TaxID=126358 RepID=A0ABD1QVE4_9LAMI